MRESSHACKRYFVSSSFQAFLSAVVLWIRREHSFDRFDFLLTCSLPITLRVETVPPSCQSKIDQLYVLTTSDHVVPSDVSVYNLHIDVKRLVKGSNGISAEIVNQEQPQSRRLSDSLDSGNRFGKMI